MKGHGNATFREARERERREEGPAGRAGEGKEGETAAGRRAARRKQLFGVVVGRREERDAVLAQC